MVRAFILVDCHPGQISSVARELEKLEGVKQADSVLGPYDVILHAEKTDLDVLGTFVTNKVQQVPGVKGTITCLSVKL